MLGNEQKGREACARSMQIEKHALTPEVVLQ